MSINTILASLPVQISISTSGTGKNSYTEILNRVENLVESARTQNIPASDAARTIFHTVLLDLGIKIED